MRGWSCRARGGAGRCRARGDGQSIKKGLWHSSNCPLSHSGCSFARPLSVARRLLERPGANLLVGGGATEFAQQEGFAMEENATLMTSETRQAYLVPHICLFVSRWAELEARLNCYSLPFLCRITKSTTSYQRVQGTTLCVRDIYCSLTFITLCSDPPPCLPGWGGEVFLCSLASVCPCGHCRSFQSAMCVVALQLSSVRMGVGQWQSESPRLALHSSRRVGLGIPLCQAVDSTQTTWYNIIIV